MPLPSTVSSHGVMRLHSIVPGFKIWPLRVEGSEGWRCVWNIEFQKASRRFYMQIGEAENRIGTVCMSVNVFIVDRNDPDKIRISSDSTAEEWARAIRDAFKGNFSEAERLFTAKERRRAAA